MTHIQSCFQETQLFFLRDQWERPAVDGAWWPCDSTGQRIAARWSRGCQMGGHTWGPWWVSTTDLKLEVWDSASETPILARELPYSPAPCIWGDIWIQCLESQCKRGCCFDLSGHTGPLPPCLSGGSQLNMGGYQMNGQPSSHPPGTHPHAIRTSHFQAHHQPNRLHIIKFPALGLHWWQPWPPLPSEMQSFQRGGSFRRSQTTTKMGDADATWGGALSSPRFQNR